MGVGWQRQGNTTILEWLWTAEGEGGGRRYQGVATDLVDKREDKKTTEKQQETMEKKGWGRGGRKRPPPQKGCTRRWKKSH
jgi:hypothetical protein